LSNIGTKGTHVIVDAYGVQQHLLDNISFLRDLGKLAIAKSGATFVSFTEKKFSPTGVTLLFLLEESHLSFHTFPEHSYIAIDLFTCGDADPDVAIDYILEKLRPDFNRVYRQKILRGVE
jgi:S-adenosylmethionine decarboxylase